MLLRRYHKKEVTEVVEETQDLANLKGMTIKDIKHLLDEKEIEYNPKAKKEDLVKLLEGAE